MDVYVCGELHAVAYLNLQRASVIRMDRRLVEPYSHCRRCEGKNIFTWQESISRSPVSNH